MGVTLQIKVIVIRSNIIGVVLRTNHYWDKHRPRSSMDYGKVSISSFSRISTASYDCPATNLVAIKDRLYVAHEMENSVKSRIRVAECLRSYMHSDISSSFIANHPLSGRLATLTTYLHALRRYQLLLLRDLIQLQERMGIEQHPRLWEDWLNNEMQIEQEAPNVHNDFLWSTQLQHDTDNGLPTKLNTPWRPVH